MQSAEARLGSHIRNNPAESLEAIRLPGKYSCLSASVSRKPMPMLVLGKFDPVRYWNLCWSHPKTNDDRLTRVCHGNRTCACQDRTST